MEKILDTENIVNNKIDKLDRLYEIKLKNIEENYNKIKKYFILILSMSDSRLNTYNSINFQINQIIKSGNDFNKYLYLEDKYRNSVNALVILIIIKESELECLRLRIFMTNNSIINDISSNIKKFIGINLSEGNNILTNCIYPRLLTILDDAKNNLL